MERESNDLMVESINWKDWPECKDSIMVVHSTLDEDWLEETIFKAMKEHGYRLYSAERSFSENMRKLTFEKYYEEAVRWSDGEKEYGPRHDSEKLDRLAEHIRGA